MLNLFNFIDKILPTGLSKLVYEMAELDIKTKIQLEDPKLEIWSRNSTKLGSFVFGISDLDLTILDASQTKVSLKDRLKYFKKCWKFLGEANYYQREHLQDLLPSCNRYELLRDPLLFELSKKLMVKEVIDDEGVEKLIFLLRLLQSDLKLESFPHIRQKKWKQHWKELGFGEISFFTRQELLKKISELTAADPRLMEGIREWDKLKGVRGFDVFHTKFSPGFKMLFPHQHLWFHTLSESEELSDFSPLARKIIKRQIDWEVWGIYTQRYWLAEDNMLAHLNRLMKVYETLASQEEIERSYRMIKALVLHKNPENQHTLDSSH